VASLPTPVGADPSAVAPRMLVELGLPSTGARPPASDDNGGWRGIWAWQTYKGAVLSLHRLVGEDDWRQGCGKRCGAAALRSYGWWDGVQMIMPGPDRPPELDVGDRVVALHSLGGFFRTRVSRGTAGIVVARNTTAGFRVSFTNGRTLDVDPTDVALPDPRDAP